MLFNEWKFQNEHHRRQVQNNRKRKAHKQLLKIIINSFYFLCNFCSLVQNILISLCALSLCWHRGYLKAGIKCAPCLFINFTFTNLHIFRHAIFATYFFHLQHAHASLPLFNFNAMLLNFIHWKKESCIKARIWENEAMRLFQNRSCIW